MSIKFAEQILDSMVDANGNCGERGISAKQYGVLRPYLREVSDRQPVGGWEGDHAHIEFYEWKEAGYIGKYHVVLTVTQHHNMRYVVSSITQWIDELPNFEGSEWQGEPKERKDLELTLVRVNSYERPAYTYGYEWVDIYTFADAHGNCYVWKTTSVLKQDYEDEDGFIESTYADPGDKVIVRATVKEHSEWKGIKQTVITRPKVMEIRKRNAA